MSTSPSWFDQEKFSRLVKKVGPKPGSEQAAPSQGGADSPHRHTIFLQRPRTASPGAQESSSVIQAPASTPPVEPAQKTPAAAPEVSPESTPPPSAPPTESVSRLPRRTAPLPALKAIFQYALPSALRPAPTDESSTGKSETTAPSTSGEGVTEAPAGPVSPGRRYAGTSPLSLQKAEDLADAWQKIAQLNDQLAHLVQERDQAVKETLLLREQLQQFDEKLEHHEGEGVGEGGGELKEELAKVVKERDDAVAEAAKLREQADQPKEPEIKPEPVITSEELALITGERDDARRQYASLREEYETLKREHEAPKDDPAKEESELERQISELRRQLDERHTEIKAVKATSLGMDEVVDKLKQDVGSLREQLARSQAEASIAQRGLALSQKALHETRDTLREITEGTSLSRTNYENLKNECGTLVQQNMLLQAQNDQLTREVSAAKSKITSRL